MTSQGSLRDLYNDPSSAWAFMPAQNPGPNASPSVSVPAVSSSGTRYTYEWKTSRPTPKSIFDLSPSNDLSDTGVDVGLLLSSLLASACMQYAGSAVAMPWEVGRLLLQVQWVPRDAGETESSAEIVEEDAVRPNLYMLALYFAKIRSSAE